jgi:diacylglycerol kinase family enzyme
MVSQLPAPLFVVNPMSGGGRTRRRWARLEAAIRRAGIEPEAVFTESRGHGYELALEALGRGRDRVVAVGGDGTVNEVARAILDRGLGGDAVVGTIPMGTGKDVGKCLGMDRGRERTANRCSPRRCLRSHWRSLEALLPP